MKLTSPSQVRALLEQLQVQPSTAHGQNFLIDANIRDLIVATAAVDPQDNVLEIGAGLGVLTEALLTRAGKVVAVEKDRRLHAYLAEYFAEAPSLNLIQADFLELDVPGLLACGITKVVANLPYSSGSRMLVELAMAPVPPPEIVVTVQFEVGERLAADAGDRQRGLLSVLVQYRYDVRIRKIVSPTCFYPRPDVRSAIVQMTRHSGSADASEREMYRALTQEAFRHRRKQLATILVRAGGRVHLPADQAAGVFAGLHIDPRIRPEELSVEAWRQLAGRLSAFAAGNSGEPR